MSDKNTDYENIKKENADKIHISFSEYSLFNQCGHRHLLEKYLGIYQQPQSIHLYFGNAIHASIEISIKEKWSLEKRIDHFKVLFTKEMMDNMKDSSDFKTHFHNFLAHGESILKYLDLNKVLDEYDLVSVEEPLYEHVYDKYYFKGFIDITLRHKITKRYNIRDWKTSGQPWDLRYKLKDDIFLGQMRFYKYFWCRKNKIPLEEVDCTYVVLNRLTDKNDPTSFPGEIQMVEINATEDEIKYSLKKLAQTLQMIHIDKNFPKVKFISGERSGCKFCPLKGGKHPLCDSTDKQHKKLLSEHKK